MPPLSKIARSPYADDERSDTDLLSAARGGDAGAYAILYHRHSAAGRVAARSITRSFEADDLVAEAFTRVFELMRDGRGPESIFRAYLIRTIRNLAIDWSRKDGGEVLVDDWERVPAVQDGAMPAEERAMLLHAFGRLPERWQQILWHLEIDRLKPREIALLLGMSPNAVSALAYRAREGLRRTWNGTHPPPGSRREQSSLEGSADRMRTPKNDEREGVQLLRPTGTAR